MATPTDSPPAPPHVYVFHGDEPLLVERAAHQLVERCAAQAVTDFALERLDGRAAPVAQVVEALQTLAFLDPLRLVWLDRWRGWQPPASTGAGAGAANRPRGRRKGKTGGDNELLLRALETLPDTAAALLTAGFALEEDPLLEALREALPPKLLTEQRFDRLQGPALRRWVEAEAARQGVRWGRGGLELLLERVPGNLLSLNSEIDKLAAWSAGQDAVDADVADALVPDQSEAEAFSWTRDVVAGRWPEAVLGLRRLAQEGDPWYLHRLMVGELRTLLLIQAGETAGLNPRRVAAMAGRARRWPEKVLSERLLALWALERSVKSGEATRGEEGEDAIVPGLELWLLEWACAA